MIQSLAKFIDTRPKPDFRYVMAFWELHNEFLAGVKAECSADELPLEHLYLIAAGIRETKPCSIYWEAQIFAEMTSDAFRSLSALSSIPDDFVSEFQVQQVHSREVVGRAIAHANEFDLQFRTHHPQDFPNFRAPFIRLGGRIRNSLHASEALLNRMVDQSMNHQLGEVSSDSCHSRSPL